MKKETSTYLTGGGGFHFESLVQASFVILMLTGGYTPYPPSPRLSVAKIKLQSQNWDTDDCIVIHESKDREEGPKFLCQVKSSIAVTKSDASFGKVIQAAWNDLNKPEFVKNEDAIALITGPLSQGVQNAVQWLLNQAKAKGADEFFRHIEQSNASSKKKRKSLEVIKYHLKAANEGRELTTDKLHKFLKHFHLLSYDLGNDDFSVVRSLLLSHMSQFQMQCPDHVFARIVELVRQRNKDGGTITTEDIPEDIREKFKPQVATSMPEEFKVSPKTSETNWDQDLNADYLALAVLVGAWDNNSSNDNEVIFRLTGIDQQKMKYLLNQSGSPLSIKKNGILKVVDRGELWKLLGSRVLDRDLDNFKSLATEVLKEPDPAFELPADERYTAMLRGKALKYSAALRKGISEGLAILGSQPEACSKCSQGKAESTSVLAISEILAGANWVMWGSLNDLLPILAEAAPGEFLNAVDESLRREPCPFDKIFSQENDNLIIGRNYLTGLLWALEGLAWDEQYLVRACVALGELASRDPGGRSSNRPSNSLVTILLPWKPETLAPFEKRKLAVKKLLAELPDIGWNLIIRLLPGQTRTSFGSHTPRWRNTIPSDRKKGVTPEEYKQQALFYGNLAVDVADNDPARLSELIEHFDKLPEPAFDQLVDVLDSQAISELTEDQKLFIWNSLEKFTNKHRRFASAGWALPDEPITRIEDVAERLAPTNLFNLHQYLFNNPDFDLYDKNDSWKKQQKKLNGRREKAVRDIFQQNGVEGIIQFAKSVVSSDQVGHAVGIMEDEAIEQSLLPQFLDTEDNKHRALVIGFIWRRYRINGWEWCDSIDKSGWTPRQIGHFLTYLPFTKKAWDRVAQWLEGNQEEYWSITPALRPVDSDLTIAIKKLIEYDRPGSAIKCLCYMMRHSNQPIRVDQCVSALLGAFSSKESIYNTPDGYQIVELIRFLQSEPSVSREDLLKVEWLYLPLLGQDEEDGPKLLGSKLANDPDFFCEVIRVSYRSDKKEEQPAEEPSSETRALAESAFRLLECWKTIPGTQDNGKFNAEQFEKWIQHVKAICTKSGHLKLALLHIGKVLIHAPDDPEGLWIHSTVASTLDARDAEMMRSGFHEGTFNSRGVHRIDPTGKPEKELAQEFRRRAEEVENAGFHRFAVTLKGLADIYEREAERIIDQYSQRDGE